MKKFLKDLETELRKNNLSEVEIQDILADHREMMETAMSEGISDSELEEKFGNPKDVADELSQFTEKQREGREKKKMGTKEFTGVQENYNVHVGLINEDVEFEHGEENKIAVEYQGKRDLNEFEITFEDNTFTLKSPRNLNHFGFFNDSESRFIITLPAGLKIGEMKLKEINGDVKLENIDANIFAVETNNGDLKMAVLKVNEFKISSINGDVKIEDAVAKEFKLSQVSGDMKMKNVRIENDLNAHTVSGDLDLEDVVCAECNLKTVSGDINGKEFYPKGVSLTSVSGDISITNNDPDKPIEIRHKKTVSGDIEIRIKK